MEQTKQVKPIATVYPVGFGSRTWAVNLNDGLRGAIVFCSKTEATAYCIANGIHYMIA